MRTWRPLARVGGGGVLEVRGEGPPEADSDSDDDDDDDVQEEQGLRLWSEAEERACERAFSAYATAAAASRAPSTAAASSKWPGVPATAAVDQEEEALWQAMDARCGRDPSPGRCRATDHDPRTRYWL